VGHDHAPAAVSAEFELVHGVAVTHAAFYAHEVALPEVANDLAAGEAAHGDDHLESSVEVLYKF